MRYVEEDIANDLYHDLTQQFDRILETKCSIKGSTIAISAQDRHRDNESCRDREPKDLVDVTYVLRGNIKLLKLMGSRRPFKVCELVIMLMV